tara:strand:+ start:2607 stop:3410 length:804 start_codon:yes stop_codon:yes gene_type:complete
MNISIGISPCPNDTYIFDALINKKIDTEGIEFNFLFADVSQLNKWAFQSKLDVTKLSYNAFFECINNYVLLDSGSALGDNCGPLLIKLPKTDLKEDSCIAIPGKYTTANMLYSLAFPNWKNKKELLFNQIEKNILTGRVDAGVIIHENRFTYKDRGLVKVIDLGEFWQAKTNLPIPLGGIFAKRSMPFKLSKKIEILIRKSIEYANANKESSMKFIMSHANEMKGDVVNSHINLYVNKFSLSLGKKGKEAIKRLCVEKKIINKDIFL